MSRTTQSVTEVSECAGLSPDEHYSLSFTDSPGGAPEASAVWVLASMTSGLLAWQAQGFRLEHTAGASAPAAPVPAERNHKAMNQSSLRALLEREHVPRFRVASHCCRAARPAWTAASITPWWARREAAPAGAWDAGRGSADEPLRISETGRLPRTQRAADGT